MLRCPSRPGIGGGVPKGWRQPVGAQLISFQSPRTPLSSGGTLSALASPKWGKEAEQPPHSPESSTASLGLAFTTYVLCVDRFSLAGGHASCGEKKSALDSVLWHDMPGGGPGADSQDAGRRAIRRARLSLRFQWLQRKPISPARDNSGDPMLPKKRSHGVTVNGAGRPGTGLFSLSQHYREGIQISQYGNASTGPFCRVHGSWRGLYSTPKTSYYSWRRQCIETRA